jgi:outer membrane protein OmpA-like peptidoglycan-associated protein
MHKFIACLTMTSALVAPAYAETLKFPDPSTLPPEARTKTETTASNDGTSSTTSTSWTYTSAQPAETTTTTTTDTNADSTVTTPAAPAAPVAASGTYVYPQADATAAATTVTGTTATTAATPGTYTVAPGTYSYGYAMPQSTSTYQYMNRPYSGTTSYYNPGYFMPGAMMMPPAPPPMTIPAMPNFAWPNWSNMGYRNGYNNTANQYMMGTQTATTTAPQSGGSVQQIDTLNKTLGTLRQQQADLVSKTQETLSVQEKTIADLKKQLEEASSGKSNLQQKLDSLQGELAASVKKAELESCKAEKGELEGKVTAIAEVSQEFAKLRENYAALESEKQRLASTLETETKDNDKDGIPDKLDKCPTTAAGVKVDATGCDLPPPPPADDDKDGVPNDADKCPTTAAGVKVDNKGCDLPPPPPADGDKDGVTDDADKCIDTKEGVKVDDKGCDLPPPDTDKDGVIGDADKCPDTKEEVKVDDKGCDLPPPDTDKDGVIGDADKCPDTKEGVKVDDKGCDAIADADKDGVADDADLCPGTAADSEVNQVGCSKTENINLKGVNFETGSSVLTASSLPVLDEAANTLKKHPDLKIEVGGHTDSSGDKVANEKLSQSRAETVMKYLVEKGAKADLLSAKGYGPNQAIADNATPEGKAQNRRVELKILQ